jgi:two-component system cell cycle sensor histidine kinase PleC
MMARVHAASTRSRAATIQGMARSVAHPAYARMVAAEPWLRRLVPVLVGTFVAILGAFAWLETQTSESEALGVMAHEVELLTSLSRSSL